MLLFLELPVFCDLLLRQSQVQQGIIVTMCHYISPKLWKDSKHEQQILITPVTSAKNLISEIVDRRDMLKDVPLLRYASKGLQGIHVLSQIHCKLRFPRSQPFIKTKRTLASQGAEPDQPLLVGGAQGHHAPPPPFSVASQMSKKLRMPIVNLFPCISL